jgi:hypothetical protein
MEDGRLWGALGVLMAVVGLVVIGPEVLAVVTESGDDPVGTLLFGIYGAGVIIAVLVTLVVIGPNLRTRAGGNGDR